MPVTYDELMALQHRGQRLSYSERDTILYALSIGMGREQVDPRELPFVYEGAPMKVMPSMATVLMASPIAKSGLDFSGVLHGEQRLRMFRPIPAKGEILVDAGVESIIDKGEQKGAIIDFVSTASTSNGDPIFSTTTSIFARRNGGIGSSANQPKPLPRVPERAPDLVVRETTRKDQALLYRLNSDLNPLHADPEVARRAGFDVPILHGLCSYGIACKALMQTVSDGEPGRMTGLDVRFIAPVFPGETLEFSIWKNSGGAAFNARVVERDVAALDNGLCMLRDG